MEHRVNVVMEDTAEWTRPQLSLNQARADEFIVQLIMIAGNTSQEQAIEPYQSLCLGLH